VNRKANGLPEAKATKNEKLYLEPLTEAFWLRNVRVGLKLLICSESKELFFFKKKKFFALLCVKKHVNSFKITF